MRQVNALSARGSAFLKSADICVLALDDPAQPRPVHKLPRDGILMSGIGVAAERDLAFFADASRVYTLGCDGSCTLWCDLSTVLEPGWNINWELSVTSSGHQVAVTLLREGDSPELRVIALDSRGPRSSMTVEYPDSGAYQIDPYGPTVFYLSTDAGGAQHLVILSAAGTIRRRLTHRYHSMELCPQRTRLVLSGAEHGAMAVAAAHSEDDAEVLPCRGHTAGWGGPNAVLYHDQDGSLCRYALGSSESEGEVLLPSKSSRPRALGSAFAPSASHDGLVLAWTRPRDDATSDSDFGTALIDLRAEAYRELNSLWYRIALLTP